MLIRCSWCRAMTSSKPPYGGKYDKEVTDGICPDCVERYFPHIAEQVDTIMKEEEGDDTD